MMKKLAALTLAFSAVAVYNRDFQMEAPMQPISGRHFVIDFTDQTTGERHLMNMAETNAVWRPFGANSWEFTDLRTGEKKAVLERNKSRFVTHYAR